MKSILFILIMIPFYTFAQTFQPKTPDDVIDQIKKHVTCDWLSETVDVYKAGEASEWETYSYVNDGSYQGKKKAVIFLGHLKSEETGMIYCAKWLQGFISVVPIHSIEDRANFKHTLNKRS